MRWDYPDANDAEESAARARIVEAMDRFWRAFADNAANLDAAFSQKNSFDVAAFTNQHLKPINTALCWEYGPALRTKGHRLVITPEGKLQLRPMVRELLRRAPSLAEWEFYPGRLPESPEVAFGVAEQIARFQAKDVQVKASLGRHRRVDLIYHVPHAAADERAANHYVYRATEQLLGEEVLDHWLGTVELAPPTSLAGKLFGGRREPGMIAPDRLKPTVDSLIDACRAQLPDPLPRQLAQRDPESVQWSSFELKPKPAQDYAWRDDVFFLMTPEPELSMAENTDPRFHSGRFTRNGETFCYLKLDRAGGGAHGALPIDSADARGKIEEARQRDTR